MKIGIGGGIGPVRGGISNKGIGGGIGPLSVGSSFRGSGGSLGEVFAAFLLGALILFWPMVLVLILSGQSDGDDVSTSVWVLAWAAEAAYAVGATWWWFFDFRDPRAIWEDLVHPGAREHAEFATFASDLAKSAEEILRIWEAIPEDLPAEEALYLVDVAAELWSRSLAEKPSKRSAETPSPHRLSRPPRCGLTAAMTVSQPSV